MKKSKKSIYDTAGMQIASLKKDLEDINIAHNKKSDELRQNACAWSIERIISTKNEIDSFIKQKKTIKNEIDKIMPTLFDI